VGVDRIISFVVIGVVLSVPLLSRITVIQIDTALAKRLLYVAAAAWSSTCLLNRSSLRVAARAATRGRLVTATHARGPIASPLCRCRASDRVDEPQIFALGTHSFGMDVVDSRSRPAAASHQDSV